MEKTVKPIPNTINRRDFLKTAGLGLAFLGISSMIGCGSKDDEQNLETMVRKPNMILILADDVGLSNLSCYGGDFSTPNIDMQAQKGVKFDYCYSTPLCGPSRCQMLTGRYPFRTGLVGNDTAHAINPSKDIMIQNVLKSAGYVTACVGKWGQMAFGPSEWGFDEHLSFLGHGRYWRSNIAKGGTYYFENGEKKNLPADKYLPDIMHEFISGFMERHKEEPFFIYYPMCHIHTPILQTPDTLRGIRENSLYASNVAYMDKLVGKLSEEIERIGISEKTLTLFTGDNGMHGVGNINGRRIKGEKRKMLEGGCRVPLIATWPGVIPEGETKYELTDFSDFMPTLAELGEANLPEGIIIDGKSVAPQIKGISDEGRKWVYVECEGESFARDYRYKLTNKGELFDMIDAPYDEIPVPRDTTNAEAIASRTMLQEVLKNHPAKRYNKKNQV